MAKKIVLSSILLLVLLTASVYLVFNDEVRIDIEKTKSTFQVYENGEWVISGVEYVNLFDGTAKMRAKNRSLETIIGEDNYTTVTRIANYKDDISTIEVYEFNPNVEDIELFPISHSIEVINGEGKLLQYEVQKLLYTGETISDIPSPQSFGHRMKVEWDEGNYYSRIWKYSGKDEGKLTIKYRIDSDNYSKNVRLFDPINWSYGIVAYYNLDSNSFLDSTPNNNDGVNYGSTNISGILEDGRYVDGINDYIDFPVNPFNQPTTTISFWTKIADEGATRYIICPSGTGSWKYQKIGITGASYPFFSAGNGVNAYTNLVSNTTITVDEWTHIVVTFIDGVNATIWTNGNITANASLIDYYNLDDMIIGLNDGASDYYNSSVDEIAVFNRSLSQEEITGLYNDGKSIPYGAQGLPPSWITIPDNESVIYESWDGVFFNATSDVAIYSYFVNDTTNFVMNSTGYLNWSSYLSVGEYYLNVSVNTTLGDINSTIYNLNVTKGILGGSLSGEEYIENGTAGDIEGTESNSGDTDVTYKLYRDGVEVSNPDTDILAVGEYDYVYNSTGGANYFSNSSIDTLTLHVSISGIYYNDENISSLDSELGNEINLTLIKNEEEIWVDIDHPDYGINYTSANSTIDLSLIINYFRKLLFHGDATNQILTYNNGFGTDENQTFNLSAHQYDEIVNVSVNITGTNNPLGVAFYKANSTEYDRVFYGNLTSDGYIKQDKLLVSGDYNTTQNISWDNEGTKYLYFLLDNNAKLISFLLNISSISYGFEFEDVFDTYDYVDEVLTNASYNGFIRPGYTETDEFTYDDFSAGTINATRWTSAITGDSYGYDTDYSTSILGGTLYSDVSLEVQACCGADDCDADLNYYQISNTTEINLYAIDGVSFELDFYSYYRETSDDTLKSSSNCDENTNVVVGDKSIWTPYDYGCVTPSGGTCDTTITTPSTLVFNLTRQIQNIWNVKISGSERSVSARDDTCGAYTIINNWTSGTRTSVFADCTDTSVSIDNDFNITISPGQYVLYLLTAIDTNYEDPECFGCDNIESWTKLDNVNYILPNYLNNTEYVSSSVFDSSYDIARVTPTISGVGTGSGVNATVTYYISGNDGDNWQNFISGVDTPIINLGQHMKWKAIIQTVEDGYTMDIPIITEASLQAEPSNISNLTFDFGDDGIIDYSIDGYVMPSNGTIQINLSNATISSSFTGTPIVGHTYSLPLVVSSDSAGTLAVEWIELIYNPNPVILNYTAIQNYLTSFGSATTLIPMIVEASGASSIVNITGLLFDYAGGNDTIEVLVHNANYSINQSLNLTYYYSRWDYEWCPESIGWIFFAPSRPTSSNVTPYGQTSSTPILNITNYGYGYRNADLSIYQNGSNSCVSTYLSTVNTRMSSSLWDGLISYWNFDYGAEDIVGGNDGTVTGATHVDGDYQDGLVSWYKFDAEGDLRDYSGSNDVTNNGATWTSDGKYDGAYNFDGDNDYINVKNNANINFTIGDSYAVSLWFKLDEIEPSSSQSLSEKWSSGDGGYQWAIRANPSGSVVFAIYNGTSYSDVSSPSSYIQPDNWYHLVAVNNGTHILLYINNSLQQIEAYTMTGDFGNDNVTIGARNTVAYAPTNGSIDDFRIYNKSLSSDEITALYERRLETLGNAYSFDGSNDYILIPNNTNLHIVDNISISAWFKIREDNQLNTIIHVGSPDYLAYGSYQGFWLGIDNRLGEKIWWQIGNGSTTRNTLNTVVDYDYDTWHHIVAIYNTTGQFIYIDGAKAGFSESYSGSIDYTNIIENDSHIGIWSSYKINGSIDELKIYNKSLTASEISELYNRSVNKYYDVKLQEDWQLVDYNRPYLKTSDIYLWADYDCNYSTWRMFEPQYYFRQCVDGGVCSTDLI